MFFIFSDLNRGERKPRLVYKFIEQAGLKNLEARCAPGRGA